ncbi:MAG: class I SAM-dependent methyltransferase [Candidatus Eremiobacteraeota bacterium]|nr:class I SAM-dependent methyltransferase [Candidatus Eremiobacteraeota bacterium]
MVGSELKQYPEYLLDRAKDRLAIQPALGPLSRRLAALFVALFGIPEIGTQVRIGNVVRRLPDAVGSLVDIGTGAGMLLEQVRRRRRWNNLVGIDLDPTSVEVAQRTHPYAVLRCADVGEASVELRHRFDVAVCVDVLEYVPQNELARFLDSCAAMLKSGGTLIVHVPKNVQIRHLRKFEAWRDLKALRVGFSADELNGLLTRCGFSDIQIFPSIGFCASLAWELNMLAAATPLQAVVFPFLLIFAVIGERFASSRNNALLCAARRK